MNDFCMCSDMKDKNQRIHELEEKICAYKAKVRDPYRVDISDLKKTIRCLKERIEELDCENEFLTKRVEELEDDNGKLESLKQHLINHVSNKEAEIVNLKEENEKLTQALKTDINRVYGVESSLEEDSEDSTDGSYMYISIPKGQKVSNFEVHFQEEHTSSITWASSPITTAPDILISPTITRRDQFGEWILNSNGSVEEGGNDNA